MNEPSAFCFSLSRVSKYPNSNSNFNVNILYSMLLDSPASRKWKTRFIIGGLWAPLRPSSTRSPGTSDQCGLGVVLLLVSYSTVLYAASRQRPCRGHHDLIYTATKSRVNAPQRAMVQTLQMVSNRVLWDFFFFTKKKKNFPITTF